MPSETLAVRAASLAVLLVALSLNSAAARETLLADSVRDYDTVQGTGGWYYGYYDQVSERRHTNRRFHLMTDLVNGEWYAGATAPSPYVWTFLNAESGHPNGRSTSAGRDSVEHWAVRRWVSPVDGALRLSGTISDLFQYNGPNDNGVDAYIFVGEELVARYALIEGTTGLSFNYLVDARVGTAIDFAIAPGRQSRDGTDATYFAATIWAVPEPGAALLGWLGAAFACGGGRRAPRRRA